jgi:hypothetical protein
MTQYLKKLNMFHVYAKHNNQIKKEALRAPIIQSVMCFEASTNK